MSDRLISANSLMSKLFVNSKGEMIPEHDCDNFPITLTIREVKDLIRNEPTAYYVDKVCEQLEKYSDIVDVKIDSEIYDRNPIIFTDVAVNIVKGGSRTISVDDLNEDRGEKNE